MYRVGFGDCFLLSIRSNGKLEHILIDCGAHYADLETIPQAVDNIAHETNGQLALVIATHNHKDHVSGFATCEKRFSDFKVGEVWLPWTMDPEDSEARRLREKQETLAAQLAFGLSAAGSRPELTAMLDNFAGPAMYDRELGIRNRHALEVLTYGFHRRDGKNGPPRVRYLAAHFGTNEPLQGPPMLSCLKATLLAPARSKPFMAMMDPPKGHHFLGLAGGIRKTQKRAVRLSPFGEEWRVPSARYVSVDLWPPDMKSTLSGVLPDDIIPLARWLEDAINNTSLVVHFSVMGKNLLFPGDAQWGSWISWMLKMVIPRAVCQPVARNFCHAWTF